MITEILNKIMKAILWIGRGDKTYQKKVTTVYVLFDICLISSSCSQDRFPDFIYYFNICVDPGLHRSGTPRCFATVVLPQENI